MHRWLPLILVLPVALLGVRLGWRTAGWRLGRDRRPRQPERIQSGSVDDAGTAVGTNTKSITITNSTIQGLPEAQN